jgi:hypothetical protein
LTIATTSFLLDRFSIATPRKRMADFDPLPDNPDGRIIEICSALQATDYLAGQGGRNYMDRVRYSDAGLTLRFFSPPETPYPQQHDEFIPNLGSIDLLLNCGPEGFDTYVRPHLALPEAEE